MAGCGLHPACTAAPTKVHILNARTAIPAAVLVLGVSLAAAGGAVAALPAGFDDSVVASGVDQPTALVFAPDGRLLVGEKTGKIRVAAGGALLDTAFLDLAPAIETAFTLDTFSERGLLGIAFDPDFATDPFVYVYYTVCKSRAPGGCTSAKNRVARFAVVAGVADPASHHVILDDIDSDAGNHNAGWIGFGPDGKLYISTGDGGSVHTKSQDLASLSGKILRIAADGTIPSDNPFVATAAARKEVWALGLRNPFRCGFRPNGELFCGDVGEGTWEEIDVIAKGQNYGWPNTEGTFAQGANPGFTEPLYTYQHTNENGGHADSSIIGGDFGARTDFPGDDQQSYFFGDFTRGRIQRALLHASGPPTVTDFRTEIGNNSVTAIIAGPDGSLYYTVFPSENPSRVGAVHVISIVAGNHAPVAIAGATPSSGAAPLDVQFSSTGSADPDGDPLTLDWDFGDGSAHSTDPAPTHRYDAPGAYVATLTVSDGQASPGPRSATVTIKVGSPPVMTISAPLGGATFRAGDTIVLAGSAIDPDSGPVPAAALHWEIIFHHQSHTHPFIDDLVGSPQSFHTATTGEADPNVAYEIVLRATDATQLTGSTSVLIEPLTADVTLATSPPGLTVVLGGQPFTAPITFTGVIGFERTVGAPSPQSVGAQPYVFTGWSDGGAENHTIVVPAVAVTLTAAFDPAPAPTTLPSLASRGAPVARAADQCQRTFAKAGGTFVARRLTHLGACVQAIATCLRSDAGTSRCMPRADATCERHLLAVASDETKLGALVRRRCAGILAADDLRVAAGLGFAALQGECAAYGTAVADLDTIGGCFVRQHACEAERLFDVEQPRAKELMRVAGIAAARLDALACLPDHGGAGAAGGGADAKPLGRCEQAVKRAASRFMDRGLSRLARCGAGAFGCVQNKGSDAKCLARAAAACDDPTAADVDARDLEATVIRACAGAVSFARLRAPDGAFLDVLTNDCGAHGVGDLTSLADYTACVRRQHACTVRNLLRFEIPRIAELLALLHHPFDATSCP